MVVEHLLEHDIIAEGENHCDRNLTIALFNINVSYYTKRIETKH